MDGFPDKLKYGAYQYRFTQNPLTSQTQLFMVGKEKRDDDRYRLNGLARAEKNHFLFQYTLSGCGRLRLGEKTYSLPAGRAMLLTIPDDNEYYVDPQVGEWEFVYIMVQGHGLEPVWKEAIRTLGATPRLRRNDPLLQLLYRQIEQAEKGEIKDNFEASRVAYDFTMELARTAAGITTEAYPPLVVQVLERLSRDYATLQGVEQLADELSVSKSHLIRVFTKATGLSPGKYLLHIRMRQAVVLLQNPELTLDEIAARLGYDNGNYFSKVFVGYFHIRPSDFRHNPMNTHAKITL